MCRPSPMLGCLPLHQCSSTLIGNSKALCSANPAILNTFELNVRSQSIKASTYTQTWPTAVTRNYTRHQCNPSHQTLPLHQILQHIGDGLSGAQMSLMAMMQRQDCGFCTRISIQAVLSRPAWWCSPISGSLSWDSRLDHLTR